MAFDPDLVRETELEANMVSDESLKPRLTLDYKVNVGDLLAMAVALLAAAAVFFRLEARVDLNEQAIRFNSIQIGQNQMSTQRALEEIKRELRDGFSEIGEVLRSKEDRQ